MHPTLRTPYQGGSLCGVPPKKYASQNIEAKLWGAFKGQMFLNIHKFDTGSTEKNRAGKSGNDCKIDSSRQCRSFAGIHSKIDPRKLMQTNQNYPKSLKAWTCCVFQLVTPWFLKANPRGKNPRFAEKK